jgi:hypothetical protein
VQATTIKASVLPSQSEYLLNPIHPNLLFDDLGCSDHFG